MKDGTNHPADKIIGLQMLDYHVGSITLMTQGRRRRIPVLDVAYVDELIQEGDQRGKDEEEAPESA